MKSPCLIAVVGLTICLTVEVAGGEPSLSEVERKRIANRLKTYNIVVRPDRDESLSMRQND